MKNYLLFLVALWSTTIFSQPVLQYEWTKQIGGTNNQYLNCMQTDEVGNIYFSFQTDDPSDQVWFDDVPYPENYQTYITKIDPDGNLIWNFGAVSTEWIDFKEFRITNNNQIIGYAIFRGIAEIADTVLVDSCGQYCHSSFLFQMDLDGNFHWAKKIPVNANRDMEITDEHIYFTGMTMDSLMIIGNDTIPNYGYSDLYILKYSIDGELLWGKHAGTEYGSLTRGLGIAIDENNNVLVGGTSTGTNFIYEGDTLEYEFSQKLIIMKVDENGELIWVKLPHNQEQKYLYDVACDDNGYVFVTGDFEGELAFDTLSITAQWNDQLFVACYNPDGNIKWVNASNTAASPNGGTAAGHYIALDNENNVFVTGKYNKSVYFGDELLNTGFYYNYNTFLTKLDGSGNFVWAKNIYNQTISDDYMRRQTIFDIQGNLITAGNFVDEGIYGPDTLFTYDFNDVYLSKMKESAVLVSEYQKNETKVVFRQIPEGVQVLNLSSDKQYDIRLFDLTGRILMQTQVYDKTSYVLKNNHLKGVIIIYLSDGETMYSEKMIFE